MSWGLLTLIFPAVGAGGLIFALRQMPAHVRSDAAAFRLGESLKTGLGSSGVHTTGPRVLRAKASPVRRFIGVLAAALIWNGIVSVVVVLAFGDWQAGHASGFLMVILSVFVLGGVALLAAVPWHFLALFNPRPRLEISSSTVALGGSFELAWDLSGRAHVVRRLQIFLEGREEATYRRGTDTSTDRHVFATIQIADKTDPALIRAGRRTVAIPANLMHSFEAPNNKIVWELKVQGNISRAPDIAEEFPLEVLPLAS
jgi:hypothetical protein